MAASPRDQKRIFDFKRKVMFKAKAFPVYMMPR